MDIAIGAGAKRDQFMHVNFVFRIYILPIDAVLAHDAGWYYTMCVQIILFNWVYAHIAIRFGSTYCFLSCSF